MKVTIDGHVIEGTPEELKGFFEMLGAKFPVNGEVETEETKTITFEGVEYTLVDRKAQDGDVVILTETGGDLFETDRPYKVVNGIEIADDDGDLFELYKPRLKRTEATVKVYERIEETPQFKEGDRVKTLADGEDGDIEAGEVGTIEWINDMPDDDDPYIIGVQTDGDDNSDYFRPQDLELVAEESEENPALKVGDIAVVIGDKTGIENLEKGDVVKLEGNRGTFDFRARRSDGDSELFNKGDLRPATDEEKAQYEQALKCAKLGRKPGEFKKGDIVRYLGGSSLKGTIVEVYSDSVFGKTSVKFENDFGICTERNEELELIAPVEARVDV